MKRIHKTLGVSIALVALVAGVSSCTRRHRVSVGSHKVTIARHGMEKKFHVSDRAPEPTLEYAGLSSDGRGLKVTIKGDKVTVNGVDGMLRPGDSVLIGDDGVAINELDYGESAKYLQQNNSNTNATL